MKTVYPIHRRGAKRDRRITRKVADLHHSNVVPFPRAAIVASHPDWQSLGQAVRSVIKRLMIDAAIRGAIPRGVTTKLVGSDWLRTA
jgi:hypothetical protein